MMVSFLVSFFISVKESGRESSKSSSAAIPEKVKICQRLKECYNLLSHLDLLKYGTNIM